MREHPRPRAVVRWPRRWTTWALLIVLAGGLVASLLVPVLYLTRVALLGAATLAFLPSIASSSPILRNLFELRGRYQVRQVALWAGIAGLAAGRVATSVVRAANERFGDTLAPEVAQPSPWWGVVPATVIIVPFLWRAWDVSTRRVTPRGDRPRDDGPLGMMPRMRFVAAAVEGIAMAGLVGVGSTLVGRLLDRVVDTSDWRAPTTWWLEGYVGDGAPTGMHVANVVLLTVAVGVILRGHRAHRPWSLAPWLRAWVRRSDAREAVVESAALAFLLQVATVLILLGGGGAFFLDRLGMSWWAAVLVAFVSSSLVLRRDHVYPVFWTDRPTADDDAVRAMHARLAQIPAVPDAEGVPRRRAVVLMGHGGGVQAAAWGARVVAELDRASEGAFSRSTILISAVSGGCLGAMHLVTRWKGDLPLDPQPLTEDVTRSAIDAIAWSWLYLDTFPTWLTDALGGQGPAGPFPDHADRAWALERDWVHLRPGWDARLSDWADDIVAGRLPLTVFNATRTEDTHRVVFSPLPLPAIRRGEGATDLHGAYVDDLPEGLQPDLDVVTAVRLSCTFPFVLPNALGIPACELGLQPRRHDRAVDLAWRHFHLADGGYFDNSGLTTAVQLLEALAVDELEAMGIDEIHLVELDPFPYAPQPDTPLSGWMSILAGPFWTASGLRTAGYVERNPLLVDQLRKRLAGTVEVVHTVARFPRLHADDPTLPPPDAVADEDVYNPPISWQMSRRERAALEAGWAAASSERRPHLPPGARGLRDLLTTWRRRTSGPVTDGA